MAVFWVSLRCLLLFIFKVDIEKVAVGSSGDSVDDYTVYTPAITSEVFWHSYLVCNIILCLVQQILSRDLGKGNLGRKTWMYKPLCLLMFYCSYRF